MIRLFEALTRGAVAILIFAAPVGVAMAKISAPQSLSVANASVAESTSYKSREELAMRSQGEIAHAFGNRFGGLYLHSYDESKTDLVVLVKGLKGDDPKKFSQYKIDRFEDVQYSLDELSVNKERVVDEINYKKVIDSVFSVEVDVRRNRVLITVDPQKGDFVKNSLLSDRVVKDSILIEPGSYRPVVATNLHGGDGFAFTNSRCNIGGNASCSVGFAANNGAQPGFLTTGHCMVLPSSVIDAASNIRGAAGISVFPNDDYAWVSATQSAPPQSEDLVPVPYVYDYTTAPWPFVPIYGNLIAPIGADVCRSGISSHQQCGQIISHNVSVGVRLPNGANGWVNGMTRASMCATAGDSGGSVYTRSGEAQGMLAQYNPPLNSNTNCGNVGNPNIWFTPVVRALWNVTNQFGPITLTTVERCGRLTAGYRLSLAGGPHTRGAIHSCSDSHRFVVETDGYVRMYRRNGPGWSWLPTGVLGGFVGANGSLEMQLDGNLVSRTSANGFIWSASTSGNPGSTLILNDNGDVQIITPGGAVSRTYCLDYYHPASSCQAGGGS